MGPKACETREMPKLATSQPTPSLRACTLEAQPASKRDSPELSMPKACETREMPKLVITQPAPSPQGCTLETPVATPNSIGTFVQQDGILMPFTEEEKARDKIMFSTPKVDGSSNLNEFLRWSSEKQAWEPLCLTPTIARGMPSDRGPSTRPEAKNPADEQDSLMTTTPSEQTVVARVGQVLTSYFAWMGGNA